MDFDANAYRNDPSAAMRSPFSRLWAVAGLAFWLLAAQARAADDGPLAPCGVAPRPTYADPGAPPSVRSWSGGKLSRDWAPQSCTGWATSGFDVLVALAGSFRHDGEVDELLARIGAISSLKGIRYWSTTDKAWRPLVTEAFALNGPDLELKGPDFTAAQFTTGRSLYFAQSDNRSTGRTIYRQRILVVDRARFALASENVTAVKMMVLTLFGAGDLQSVYFLERRSPGVWSFYSLSRTRNGSSMLSGGHEASYINRAVAFYRHVAGIPTDQEPPAAR
jgi:hypothetical protein